VVISGAYIADAVWAVGGDMEASVAGDARLGCLVPQLLYGAGCVGTDRSAARQVASFGSADVVCSCIVSAGVGSGRPPPPGRDGTLATS